MKRNFKLEERVGGMVGLSIDCASEWKGGWDSLNTVQSLYGALKLYLLNSTV